MKTFLVTALLLAAAACGDDSLEFTSLAREPEGEPITFRYRLEPGRRYVRDIGVTMTMELDGPHGTAQPAVESGIRAAYTVREVLSDGRFRLRVEMQVFAGGAPGSEQATPGLEATDDKPGEMILSPTGEVEVVRWPASVGQLVSHAGAAGSRGLGGFMRFPEEGLRVGQAIDFRQLVSEDALGALSRQISEEGGARFRGELVLDRIEEVDGERAAVFALNVVAHLDAAPEGEAAVEMRVRMTGEVACSLATGMQVGEARVRSRAEGEVGGQGRAMEFSMTQVIAIENRREEAPAGDDGSEGR